MHPLLRQTSHRPIPMPHGPWIMVQNWCDLLFAHWEVSAEQLRRMVPSPLELDLLNGKAYVAVTPFRITRLRSRYLSSLPAISRSEERRVGKECRFWWSAYA